jgi:hypothetical protein
LIKSDVEKSSPIPASEIKPKEKRKRGRPKGSKNNNKADVILTSELVQIQKMINSLFKLLAGFVPLTYLVLDGHFGNNNALQTRHPALFNSFAVVFIKDSLDQ